jgi:hypothetical protein
MIANAHRHVFGPGQTADGSGSCAGPRSHGSGLGNHAQNVSAETPIADIQFATDVDSEIQFQHGIARGK